MHARATGVQLIGFCEGNEASLISWLLSGIESYCRMLKSDIWSQSHGKEKVFFECVELYGILMCYIGITYNNASISNIIGTKSVEFLFN